MLTWSSDGKMLQVREECGLEWEFQILEVPFPAAAGSADDACWLDRNTGTRFPLQRSAAAPERGFLGVRLEPGTQLELELADSAQPELPPGIAPVTVREEATAVTLDNGLLALKLSRSGRREPGTPGEAPGPVLALGHRGSWFGGSYFDTLSPVVESTLKLLERGPLRVAAEFLARLADGGWSRTRITLDAGQRFARIDEAFQAHESDQLVWEFGAGALPELGFFLNATPGYETRKLDYCIDQQSCRLGPWSQQSQLDASDGCAFLRPGSDTVFGLFTLAGGSWRGNRLNFVDVWQRRLRHGDRKTRRLVPPEEKADAVPGPAVEYNPQRDRSACLPVLTWEGWLGSGERHWGLLVAPHGEFVPAAGDDLEGVPPPNRHLQVHPEACRPRQGLLRKLHIQRGLLPLQQLFSGVFEAVPADRSGWSFDRETDFMAGQFCEYTPRDLHATAFVEYLTAFIRTRVVTFWYAGGAADTNPVSSRQVAPFMLHLEELAETGALPPETVRELRAKLLLLAMIMHTPNYYPGASAMLPADDPDALNLPLKGMANQNFYTDVINLFGFAGVMYPQHPEAAAWRNDFIRLFSRQLEIHVNPESGVWEESHTYFQHVLLTVLPLLLALRDTGRHDFFADPRLQRMLRAAVAQVSTRDRVCGGARHLVPFGDHEGTPEPYKILWRHLARAVAPHDVVLAAELNWLGRECGGQTAPELPVQAPVWQNEYLPALGIFFRETDPEVGETLLALRSGSAWGHHHDDDGSFWLYAAERVLIGDSGMAGRTSPTKLTDRGHSRWIVPGKQIHNYHWRFLRGWPVGMELTGETPWATVYTPAACTLVERRDVMYPRMLRHFRSVLRLGARTFLIVDSTLEPGAYEYHFHLGTTGVRLDGVRVLADYGDGVQLELRALDPQLICRRLPDDSGNAPQRTMDTAHLVYAAPAALRVAAFLIRFGRNELPPEPSIQVHRRPGGEIEIVSPTLPEPRRLPHKL